MKMVSRFDKDRYAQVSNCHFEDSPRKKTMDKDVAVSLLESKMIKETVNSSHSELLNNSVLRRLIEEIEANYV